MHLYIDHLKNNSYMKNNNDGGGKMKTEFEGLTHLLDLTSAVEEQMADWQTRLASMGDTLAATQKMIEGLSGELGLIMDNKKGGLDKKRAKNNTSSTPSNTSSSSWFWITLFLTFLTIGTSLVYFDLGNFLGMIKR